MLTLPPKVCGFPVTVLQGAGLSFGYRVRGSAQGTYRELTDLDLIEVP